MKYRKEKQVQPKQKRERFLAQNGSASVITEYFSFSLSPYNSSTNTNAVLENDGRSAEERTSLVSKKIFQLFL